MPGRYRFPGNDDGKRRQDEGWFSWVKDGLVNLLPSSPDLHDPEVSVLTNSLAMALKKVRTPQNSKNGFEKGSDSQDSGFQ